MLRAMPRLDAIDDLHRHRVDHRDVIGAQIGHVDPFEIPAHRGAQMVRSRLAIDSGRIHDRRHPRYNLD